ncbi:hypothetical protein NEF87_002529 [Candidatus Lokiarchaeum ossiferum]|uniref:Uncharacterized protein n=1 Tax=Candidatus Lokiarchaeum ossiferum TaxID=2951803 RepID=A0ABY6HUV7_9ARCH|nr:hypothetical protein NEF87_002529 [Candidatus Lokiarchaeum sp. B-35]
MYTVCPKCQKEINLFGGVYKCHNCNQNFESKDVIDYNVHYLLEQYDIKELDNITIDLIKYNIGLSFDRRNRNILKETDIFFYRKIKELEDEISILKNEMQKVQMRNVLR